MYLTLLSYKTKPDNIDIYDYVKNNKISNTLYYARNIIESGGFSLLMNSTIHETNQIINNLYTALLIHRHQYKQSVIDKKQLNSFEITASREKQKFENDILFYSSLTSSELIKLTESGDIRSYYILEKNINKCLNKRIKPLYNEQYEEELLEMYSNPFMIDIFKKIFNHNLNDGPSYLLTNNHIHQIVNMLEDIIQLDSHYYDTELNRIKTHIFPTFCDLKKDSEDTLYLLITV